MGVVTYNSMVLPINKEKFITKITLVNIMLISFTACLFIYLFGTIGIVMSILLSEVITFVILTYSFSKKTKSLSQKELSYNIMNYDNFWGNVWQATSGKSVIDSGRKWLL